MNDAHHFTSAEWIALITVLLTGITTMVTTILNTWKLNSTGKKVEQQGETLAAQDKTLDRVENQTNGNLGELQKQLALAHKEVADLRAAQMVSEAAREEANVTRVRLEERHRKPPLVKKK